MEYPVPGLPCQYSADNLRSGDTAGIGYRAEEPHLHGDLAVVLQFLPCVIVSVDHQMDVVFLNPGAVGDKGSVGKHFVNVASPGYHSDTLFHSEDGLALVGHDNVV